ncbi:DNA helicase RecQ [Patescibacteria group bacterium]|nr:DNA helicase RecQ [Patescibacteria group bacterium]
MEKLLKTHFGFDRFRPLQRKVIDDVLEGRDTLAVMMTGGGKSLCYQLPALIFEGLTLVVSPLISLMKDQVDALRANGINAEFINSSVSNSLISEIMRSAVEGEIKILYVAPERLAVSSFQDFLRAVNLSLIAIDEAHCISEWGHDFRPDYRNLKRLRRNFPYVPIISLTATATAQVRKDIIKQLSLQRPSISISSFDRDNLSIFVRRKQNSFGKLLKLLQDHKNEAAIIYCFSRAETEKMAVNLKKEGFNAIAYHGGMSAGARRKNQDLFIKDKVNIICATIAFGMGIDKPDVRLVVHYTFPKSIEGYYQEIGRAGRDGLKSECVLFYSLGDKHKYEYFNNEIEDAVERRNAGLKIQNMIDFCEGNVCRRKTVLTYFGENYAKDNCGNCDVCLCERSTFDATEIAQKILSCVIRTGSRFGAKYISDVLKGRKLKRIIELGHSNLSVFGLVKDYSDDELRQIIQQLVSANYLIKTEGQYAQISVSNLGNRFLKKKESFFLLKPKEEEVEVKPLVTRKGDLEYDLDLFELLRVERRKIADSKSVPPFIIFGDVSLRAMAYYYPTSLEEFAKITGVGKQKLARFGEVFVGIVKGFVDETGVLPIEVPEK